MRRLATVAVVLAMVGALLVLTTTLVVRGVLLDEGTYRGALMEADAYERLYTEVLADPELSELSAQLIGGLALVGTSAADARILTTNALRWTLPPERVRVGAETVIDATVAYLRGDVDRLDLDVDVTGVLDRIDATALVAARAALADAVEEVVRSLPEYRTAIGELLDELAVGRVPSTIPVVGGTAIDAAEIVEALVGALGTRVDEELVRRVVAAVLAGDERDALIDAAIDLVTEHATRVSDALRASAEDRRVVDLIAELADRAGQPARNVVAVLDGARDAVRWTRPTIAIAAGAILVGGLAALGWLHRDRPSRASYAIAVVLALGGIGTLVGWWFVAATAAEPLSRATGTGPGTWGLPAGLRTVLADVEASIAAELGRPVRGLTVLLLGTAAVVAAVTAFALLLGRLRSDGRSPVRTVVAVIAAVVVAVVVVPVVSISSDDVAAAEPRACNGHPELCERAYDEVVYAATHNAMSSPDVVDIWPEHDGNIAAQLDAGVRALLIDTHYWTEVVSADVLTAAEPLLPPRLATTLYSALGERLQARDGAWLCHIHCALGGIRFVDALVMIRDFLAANPDEVVTLIIQDAITVADTEAAFVQSGLAPYLYTHDGKWPTLGEMIDGGERLVVLAENQGPPPAWYHQGFELMQETPYLFREPADFSCVPNRGLADATLFQLNHWVQRVAPDRADSAEVNRHDVLVARALQCQAERGLLPNFVAVNHYSIGDLMEAVDTLNGVA